MNSGVQFILFSIGAVAILAVIIWISVVISMKRDKKKCEQKKAENQEQLSRIKKYLDSVAISLNEDDKALVFKLKNRWEIIYTHYPIKLGTGYHLPIHPKVISACADRDNIEVQLMDKGIRLEYPN